MDNFKVIYKFLKYLESALDFEEHDKERLKGGFYGVSDERFNSIIEMLYNDGYIQGLVIKRYTDGGSLVKVDKVKITLKGLEYLEENSMMRKIANAVKGIVDVIS